MTISEKVAYLKGLAEGLGLDTDKSKEAKLISVMVGILEEVGLSIEDLETNALALGEEIDALSDDLAEVESLFSEEEDDCGCGGHHHHHQQGEEEDSYMPCPNCEQIIVIDDDAIETGDVSCEACGARFSIHFTDVEEHDGEGCGCGCGCGEDDIVEEDE